MPKVGYSLPTDAYGEHRDGRTDHQGLFKTTDTIKRAVQWWRGGEESQCPATVKCAFKDALRTGRIYKQRWTVHDPVPQHPTGGDLSYLGFPTAGVLDQDEWIIFQNRERAFRKTLDTKHLEDKHHFNFSGDAPTKWIKLIRILNGVYFKNGTFSICRENGKPFGIPFLKFTIRILRKMPTTNTGLPETQTLESLGGWIESDLRFLRDAVQPALGVSSGGTQGEKQITELCQEYIHRITLIDSAPLPVRMKIEAIRQIAVAKIQHLFRNVHISQQNLLAMNNATVNIVRKWLCLNTRTTRDILFQPRNTGGLGVPNIEWLYTSSRIGHLLSMLNNDDMTVRELARESLFLHLQRRKIPIASQNEPQFLGFKLKQNGKLDIKAAGFGVRSDWLDLNDLCHRIGLQLSWQGPDGATSPLTDNIITDSQISTLAILNDGNSAQHLHTKHARASLLQHRLTQNTQRWSSLKMQGKGPRSMEAFKEIDLDQDKTLTREEVKRYLQLEYQRTGTPKDDAFYHKIMEDIFRKSDHDSNGRITAKEYNVYDHDEL
ncbi:Peptidyl-prolyl cis-trans isomerase FKBP7 [Merluccius polli]|uniref:peptidylprolyl isomerase n=1 Tax=Merluccius polli TaxID=89951 RepID=A0AA47NP08_MERPO|nr:Peptidyl-prolyl cis-trans isomerase FKBP7 [Merluccius polli]